MSKKVTMLAVCLGLAAGPVFAGPLSPASETGVAAERQGAVKAQATGEHMSDAQKANLEALSKQLKAIEANSEVTDEQKQALATSLTAIADGATKPSDESIEALASSLSTAKADGEIQPEEAMKIAQDVATVCDSANVSPEEAKAAISDVQAILDASGVDKDTAKKVASDLQVIAEELRKNTADAKDTVQKATGADGSKKRRGK